MQPIGDAAQELAAEYICTAHDIMSRSHHGLFVTHNDFQGTTSNDTTGLIPDWTGTPSCLPLNKHPSVKPASKFSAPIAQTKCALSGCYWQHAIPWSWMLNEAQGTCSSSVTLHRMPSEQY